MLKNTKSELEMIRIQEEKKEREKERKKKRKKERKRPNK
jgi:hypothetical protein